MFSFSISFFAWTIFLELALTKISFKISSSYWTHWLKPSNSIKSAACEVVKSPQGLNFSIVSRVTLSIKSRVDGINPELIILFTQLVASII